MRWAKIDSAIHTNPKIMAGGHLVREVYILLLCRHAQRLDGVLEPSWLLPAYIASLLGSTEERVQTAIARMHELRLIATTDGVTTIVGWDDWRSPSASRMARHRASLSVTSASHQRHSDAHVTSRDAHVTPVLGVHRKDEILDPALGSGFEKTLPAKSADRGREREEEREGERARERGGETGERGKPIQGSPRQTAARTVYSAEFESIWAIYPRRTGKGAAAQALRRALETTDLATIAAGIERHLPVWAADAQPGFIPHLATWLNQRRWDDEPQPRGGRFVPSATTRYAGGDVDL